jgi:hypothetical protein
MWENLHNSIISLHGEAWAYITSLTPPHVIRIPVSSSKIERSYICVLGVSIVYVRLDFETVPTVWYLLSLILSLSWHVHYCTLYSSSYLPSDLHQNVVMVNTNRNTRDLLFKSLFSVYCFVDHFRLLVPFFHWSLCCLSLLKNSLTTPKRQSKPVNVRMDTTMTHSDLESTTQKTKDFTAAGSPFSIFNISLYICEIRHTKYLYTSIAQ